MSWKLCFHVLGRASSNFSQDHGTQLAASISYYALFSLFPATLLAVSIFGIVLRDEELQQRVLNGIIDFLPVEGSAVTDSIEEAADLGPTVTVVSFFGALWTAGALSAAIRQTLNQVFEVRQRRPLVQAKLMDFVLLPLIGLPLLGGVVLTTVWRLFEQELDDRWGILDGRFAWTWDVGAVLIPLVLSFVAFVGLYRLAPARRPAMRYVWPGALVAALGFELLKVGFAFYIEHFGNYSIYGSLGSVIVLLFWVYLTANILIFGAEISNVLSGARSVDPETEGEPVTPRRAVMEFVRGLFLMPKEEETEVLHRRRRDEEEAAG